MSTACNLLVGIGRRYLIVLAAALSVAAVVNPIKAAAQAGQKMHRIGLLCYLACPNATTKQFGDQLLALGYVAGQNAIFEYRHADGKSEKFGEAVRELVEQKVDVILSFTTPGTRAAKQATTTVPIVFATGADPIAIGLVNSLEKPGGNLTGVTEEAPDLAGKRLGLLKEIVPGTRKLGIMWEGVSYGDKATQAMVARTEQAVRAAGIEAVVIEWKGPADVEDAFATLVRAKVDGLLLEPTTMVVSQARRIAELAAKNKIPTLWPGTLPQLVQAGALIMMGADLADVYPRAAQQVDKILKGAKPSDLPVAHTEKFILIVNKKAASELGLTLPQSLLARANRVID